MLLSRYLLHVHVSASLVPMDSIPIAGQALVGINGLEMRVGLIFRDFLLYFVGFLVNLVNVMTLHS